MILGCYFGDNNHQKHHQNRSKPLLNQQKVQRITDSAYLKITKVVVS